MSTMFDAKALFDAKAFERTTFSNAAVRTGFTAPANPSLVPRCGMRIEMTPTGCRIHCVCEDELAAATLQELCKMLAGQCCGLCCTFNGQTVCQVNLCCCHCVCEPTADGCCITCKTGDEACCAMTQKCCAAIAGCLESGCRCTISFGNTPVCCG